MGDEERRLLLPRTRRRDDLSSSSLPGITRPLSGSRDYQTLGVSPGGYSWHRWVMGVRGFWRTDVLLCMNFFVGRSQSMVPGLVMELLVLRPLQSQSKRYKLIIKYCWVTLHQLTFFWRNINVYFTESKYHLESDSSWELYFLSWLEFSHVRLYGILSSCCQ